MCGCTGLWPAWLLMLGWPLAVPTLCLVAVLAGLLRNQTWEVVVTLAFWRGVPATLALGLGAGIRRVVGFTSLFTFSGVVFLALPFACLLQARCCNGWSLHNRGWQGAVAGGALAYALGECFCHWHAHRHFVAFK